MQKETKNCQNCKKDFTIEPDDFGFYEKIKVPPPTFCPECRRIRRLMWRSTRSLHKRSCGLCSKSLISMYSENHPAPVYCIECWYGSGWDPMSYGKEYDFSKPFFEQLKELWFQAPRLYAYKFGNLINSDFINFAFDDKNVYLSYSVIGCEDVSYSDMIDKSKNCLDCLASEKLEGCSYNIDCESNYNTHYAVQSKNCIDSLFLYDCMNCNNCCLSSGLRNQQYVFKNKKMSKKEYEENIRELNLGVYNGFEKVKKEFDDLIKNTAIHKYAFIYGSQNATGDYIHNVRNVKNCFDTNNSENIAFGNRVVGSKDCMDNTGVGWGELIYDSMATTDNTFKDYFCYITFEGSRECQYTMICKNCSNCFGCVGLTNAKYCIFNKQYTEAEYKVLVEKIKKHMMDMPYVDSKGRIFTYGEYFPYDMLPCGYNETNAQEFFPISKKEAEEKCYPWQDRESKTYQITIESKELLNDIMDVTESILNEVISCPNNGDQMYQCTEAFRVTNFELQFLKQKNLPLPRFCPNCRHYKRLKYKNPMHLYKRQCMKEGCSNEFETAYAPDRQEIVYCESCYNKEVY